ncbi:hypothetical protein AXX17_AT5G20180 [Arabidopsis thaliana]|nr:hypothetical protein AXX17_AT5G20180 [Arabidopsis thaliana]
MRKKKTRFQFLLNPNSKFVFFPRAISSSSSSSSDNNNDGSVSSSRQNNRQMGYDPSEELFGVDFKPRSDNFQPLLYLIDDQFHETALNSKTTMKLLIENNH